jgi:hypothetical protein
MLVTRPLVRFTEPAITPRGNDLVPTTASSAAVTLPAALTANFSTPFTNRDTKSAVCPEAVLQ